MSPTLTQRVTPIGIRFQEVSKRFGPKVILDRVSYEIHPGEIFFILGRSGVGKSVSLKQMVGVLRPDSGEVYVGEDRVSDAVGERLERVRQRCGMVFQHPALLDSLTVFENVAFGLRMPSYSARMGYTPNEDQIRARVVDCLKQVELGEELLNRMPQSISYGMQKRVSLARTLAPAPSALLFDEPTTGLDPVTTRSINRLILKLSHELGVTSVVVSHDMESAFGVADRILLMDAGKIVTLATPEEIARNPAPLAQQFLEDFEQDVIFKRRAEVRG
jgi:phospholipid/cholesterol/gamma-HCH transport system ATP-binding protein